MQELVLYSRFLTLTPEQIEQLKRLHVSVSKTLTPEVNAIYSDQFFIEQNIQTLPKLKYLQVATSGTDLIDLSHPNLKGVTISGSRGIFNASMSEYVLGQLIRFYRHFGFYQTTQAAQQWRPSRHGEELGDKKVAIIGLGQIGLSLAKTLSFMGCKVDGFNRRKKESVYVQNTHPLSALEEHVGDYDIVIVTIALTQDTQGLLSASVLKKLSKQAVFVNIARAEVLDQETLVHVLQDKLIRFAILDTFANEPLPKDHPLWTLDNVSITPHISFTSPKNLTRMFEALQTNLTLFQQGERLINQWGSVE
jgi:phosphoglycerate dehydrogenase-like enzyme